MVVAALVVLLPLLAPHAGAASPPEWNIDRIGAPASGAGAIIAVVDTGVDAAHPAFTGRVLPAIDLVGGRGGDPNGHGTHVAGTAAGADQGCGSIGVAPDAWVLPVRVLDEKGEGTVGTVAQGIRQAADRGATVINLSLGGDVVLRNLSGSDLQDAIRYAWSKGSIPVLAAGNDGLVGGVFGSGYGDLPAVVVTATDHTDRAASYATSIGSAAWGVAAPGGDTSGQPGRDILSAFPDRRCALQAGTSMAAPHVSGALAALRASGLNPRQAVDRLLATARDVGSQNTFGSGLVDLRAALGRAPAAPSVAAAPPAPAPSAPASQSTPAAAPPGAEPARAESRERPVPTRLPLGGPTPPAPGAAPAADDEADGDGDIEVDETTTTKPTSGLDESASPVIVRDAEGGDDDEGPPAALVAVAVAALAVSGVGAGVIARSIRRRPGPL